MENKDTRTRTAMKATDIRMYLELAGAIQRDIEGV
jgi:hypothetical protein